MKSPIKRHGGKFYLARKIVEQMPPHIRYVEAYAGSAAVLFAKDCNSIAEYVNDTDGNLMNFWRVLRDTPDRLLRALWGTPVSQEAFVEAKQCADSDAVRRATAFFIQCRQSRQALGRDYCTPTSRLRGGMNEQVSAWWGAIDSLPEIHERLRRVEVWCQPAVEAIRKLDSESTLFYLDPPYLLETRASKGEYGEHEMTTEQHEELLSCLSGLKGGFLLSGYASELYSRFAEKNRWDCLQFELPNNASSSREKQRKTEHLWANFELKHSL